MEDKSVTVRLTAEEVERLDKLSKDTFRKRSDLIRLGLNLVFEAEAEKEARKEVQR